MTKNVVKEIAEGKIGVYALSGSHKKVLLYVASYGPNIKYKIEKGSKVNRSLVHQIVNEFVAAEIFSSKIVGKSRVGLPITEYGLTFYGLCLSLELNNYPETPGFFNGASANSFSTILEKWRYLEPLILGNCRYFCEKLGRDRALSGLFHCVYGLDRESENPKSPYSFVQQAIGHTLDYYENQIRRLSLLAQTDQRKQAMVNYHITERNKWLDAFLQDTNLNPFVKAYIDDKIRLLNKSLNYLNDLKQMVT